MSRIPHSLRILVGLILLFALSVPLSQAFMRWHMERIAQELTDLAVQLGYKPEDLLLRSFSSRDTSIVLPLNEYCDAKMYFATPLTVEQFVARVHEVVPATIGQYPGPEQSTLLYTVLPLAATSATPSSAERVAKRVTMDFYEWNINIDSGSNPISISFYDLENTPASFEYRRQPFKKNVVRLYKNGGNWPLWFHCPTEITAGAPQ